MDEKMEAALKAQAGLIRLKFLTAADLSPDDRKIIDAAIDLASRWSR